MYEYKVINLGGDWQRNSQQEILNRLSCEDWELVFIVAIVRGNDHPVRIYTDTVAYFRRKIEE